MSVGYVRKYQDGQSRERKVAAKSVCEGDKCNNEQISFEVARKYESYGKGASDHITTRYRTGDEKGAGRRWNSCQDEVDKRVEQGYLNCLMRRLITKKESIREVF